jgi:hypothetical protein
VPDILALEQQAIELAKRGDFGVDAKQANEELTRQAPGNQGAWTRLARCCMELGLLDEATAALETALQLNPQNTIARNLHLEVARRRMPAAAPRPRAARRTSEPRAAAAGQRRAEIGGGFGRAEFTGLEHLAPAAAVDALGPRIESVLMALNERPFAAKVVEARNRAGRSGNWLFRRDSFHAGGPGHIFAYQYGGRWEPQINVAWTAATRAGRHCVRAGLGFNLTQEGRDPDPAAGQERAVAHFERFQQLVSSTWRQLLTDWMGANGGFIQVGGDRPALDLLPAQAVAALTGIANPREAGWIFCGAWLFLDHPDHEATLRESPHLVRWMDRTFTDLLPLWSSVYRG